MRKRQNDQRRREKDLMPLQKGESVWIIDTEAEGVIAEKLTYMVQTPYNF